MISISFIFPVLFCITATFAGQDIIVEPSATELVIAGGSVFMAWPETDSFMTCGLTILSPRNRAPRRKPVHLVVLIDISRQMQGEPLGAVKQAIQAAIEKLNDGDMFGLVSFSTYIRDVFPMQVINPGVRASAQAAVAGLGDEDRRNTLDGIRRAMELFDRFKGQDATGRYLFLITNGNPDNGTTDGRKVLDETVRLAADAGVSISTFGFRYFDRGGENFDEDVLLAMADRTGGRYHFIDDPENIGMKIMQEADLACNATARKITIRITPPGKVSFVSNVAGGIVAGDGTISVGDMAPAGMRMVVFDIEGRPKRQNDCEVTAKYLEADGLTEREMRTYINIALASGAPRLNPAVAPRVIAFDLQASLAETAEQLAVNRSEYTMVFKDKIKDLEQENVILDSDYIRQVLSYYERFERILTNSSVENTVVQKTIKYRALQMLSGE
jgi:hypothetical protein